MKYFQRILLANKVHVELESIYNPYVNIAVYSTRVHDDVIDMAEGGGIKKDVICALDSTWLLNVLLISSQVLDTLDKVSSTRI